MANGTVAPMSQAGRLLLQEEAEPVELTLEERTSPRRRGQDLLTEWQRYKQEVQPQLLQRTLDAKISAQPPASGPNILDRFRSGLEARGEAELRSGEAIGEISTPVLEAGLGVATGLVGAASGATKFAVDMYANLGVVPGDRYWETLYNSMRDTAEEMTYQPRSELGQQLMSGAMKPIELLMEFSRVASEAPLARMVLTEDQRYALRFAHEIATFAALDVGIRGSVRAVRPKIEKFREEFARTKDVPAAEAPELLAAAEDLRASIESVPEVSGELQAARQRFASTLDTIRQQSAARTTEAISAVGDRPSGRPGRTPEQSRQSSLPGEADALAPAPAAIPDTYARAVQAVREGQNATINYVARKAKVKSPEARALIERMEAEGVVSPKDGRGRRKVLSERDQVEGQVSRGEIDPEAAAAMEDQLAIGEQLDAAVPIEPTTVTPVKPPRKRAPRKRVVKQEEPVAEPVPGETIEGIPLQQAIDTVREVGTPAVVSRRLKLNPDQTKRLMTELSDRGLIETEVSFRAEPIVRTTYEPTTLSRLTERLDQVGDFGAELSSGPIQIRRTGGKPDAIFVHAHGNNALTALADIREQLRAGKISPEIAEFLQKKLREQGDIAGVAIEEAHLFSSDRIFQEAQALAAARNLELYRAKRASGGLEYEQVPREVIEAGTQLESGNILEPTTLSPESKSAFVEDRTRPVGQPTLDDIVKALERGEDISGTLSEDIRPYFQDMLEGQMQGMNTNEIRGFFEVLKDVLDVIAPGDIPPSELGMLSIYGLTPRRQAAARRLMADAQKAGVSFKNMLDRTQLPESEKALFVRYMDAIEKPQLPRGVDPQDMRLSGGNVPPEGDFIVSQRAMRRKGKETKFAPRYKSEVDAIQNAPVLKRNIRGMIRQFDLNTPYSFLRRAQLLDPIMYAYRASQQAASIEGSILAKDLRTLAKRVPRASRERIMEYGFGQDRGGAKLLKEAGREAVTLNANEQVVYDAMRNLYDETWLRVNEAREAIGKPLMAYEPNYLPHMRAITLAEQLELGPNIVMDSAAKIRKMHNNYTNLRFPQEKQRRRGKFAANFDAFDVLNDYMQMANKQVHLGPFLAKLEELINHPLPDPVTGKNSWKLAQKNPVVHDFLQDWKNFLTTGVQSSLPRPVRNVAQFAMNNLAISLLSASVRTAGVQLGVLRNTAHDFGPKWMALGAGDYLAGVVPKLDMGTRRLIMKNSKVLDTRGMIDTYNDVAAALIGRSPRDFVAALREGKLLQVQQTLGEPFFKPMQLMDGEAAMFGAQVAYQYGKQKLGYSGNKLWNFVDDAVVRQSGGTMPGDVVAAQRTLGGRFFTQFQRFLINDFNYFWDEVAGVREVQRHLATDPNKWAPFYVKNTLRFIAATTIANIVFEDFIGMQSPYPTPIRAMMKGRDSNEGPVQIAGRVAMELVEPFPVVGATRFGRSLGGATLETVEDVTDMLRSDPLAYRPFVPSDTPAQAAMRLYGSPLAKLAGAPGASQVGKIVRGIDRGGSVQESLFGFYKKPPSRGGAKIRQGIGRPSGGLRRLR